MNQPAFFQSQGTYTDRNKQRSIELRNVMFEKFKRHITLLLEQKKSRQVPARKGYLNPRALYRHRFDNVFQKVSHITRPIRLSCS